MAERINRRWLLARRPQGIIGRADFRFEEARLPEPGEGEVLVRVLLLSCDPTQRGWASFDTYLPAVPIGDVMRSFAAGQIVASRHPGFKEGDLVQGLFGWQDYAVMPGSGPMAPSKVVPGVPLETAMSALGLTGLTAYFGLLDIGQPKEGESVLVSGAAGATGSVAGQIAKIKGCRVVGIAGGKDKCALVTDVFGFDACIDYRSEKLTPRVAELCPKGVDVFYDNVGGEALDAALARLALRGRIVLCGGISRYSDDEQAPGPRNYLNLIVQRGRMQGFVVTDFAQRFPEAVMQLAQWLQEGRIKDRIDLQHGLENAPETLARLFKGENQGKQLLRIAEAA